MARLQYRYHGLAAWQSQSGNALIALQNIAGSGKKVIIHTIEVHPRTRGATTGYTELVISRATVTGGTPISLAARDTAASLPSGIQVLRFSSSTSRSTLLKTLIYKNLSASTSKLGQNWGPKGKYGGNNQPSDWFSVPKDGALEPIVIRAGEAVAVSLNTATFSNIYQVTGTLVVNGTPNRTYNFSTIVWAVAEGADLISIVNNSISDVVKLKNIDIKEMGTTDTPYIQVVPVGGINPQSQSDATALLSCSPLDSAYGALDTSKVKLISDAPLIPYGVPVNYISDGSTGSPKGFNYLHTKDFLGPTFGNILPEVSSTTLSTTDDTRLLGKSPKQNSLLLKGSPIVVREGEAIAIVSASETAVVTSAVGTAGWALFDFGIIFSIEPAQVPIIAASGMVVGSRYRVERVSDNSLVTTGIVDGTGSFSYSYDAFTTTENMKLKVRNASGSPNYQPYEVTFSLPITGITIPVSQALDE